MFEICDWNVAKDNGWRNLNASNEGVLSNLNEGVT